MQIHDNARDVLDVADGIDRVMGDRRLYARVLARFRHDYAGGAAAILRALDAGNTQEAQRLAHSLKGASGLIGAPSLHRQASSAEQAIRLGTPQKRELAAALDGEFDQIYRLLDVLVALPQLFVADPGLMTQLAYQLLVNDEGAVTTIESASATLGTVLDAATLSKLREAAARGDSALALRTLREAAQQ